ncbi:MAG: phosphoribosyl-ATP diphosphatase [Leptospiraceae bacterium]|nr:phosphoribosyl-ATP diphosphatase [Leptospiraceae bacterium]
MQFFLELEELLKKRKLELPENSYTSKLFQKGLDKILKKVGEESGEVIIAAKNTDKQELIHEIADLIFHLQVLLVEKNFSISDIEKELQIRHNKKS